MKPWLINPGRSKHQRGFTLVELMVAVTGGLFVSVIVFAMARQGTRFYQQETRVAEATLGATIGMQRLRADISRAGYMSSAYIGPVAVSDPNLCMDYNGGFATNYPLLGNMRNIQVIKENLLGSNTDPIAAGITPDQIVLSGAYQNADRFIAGMLLTNGNYLDVPLQPNIGALARYKYLSLSTAAQQSLMTTLFPSGRLLRLVNQYGRIAYGYINTAINNGGPNSNLPTIRLEGNAPYPTIPLQGAASNVCVFSGVGTEVNVVNFYRYRIANLKGDPTYQASYGQLFASTLANSNPADANRTELIREELNPASQTSAPFAQVPELVAEYAVDLKFEVSATPQVGPNSVAFSETTPGSSDVYAIAGNAQTAQPQRVRSVRARLSIRSREADRTSNVPSTFSGLYRISIVTGQTTNFARVRTVQSDIAIPNNFGVNW